MEASELKSKLKEFQLFIDRIMPSGRIVCAVYASPNIFRSSEDEVFNLGAKIVKTLPGKKFKLTVHPFLYGDGCYFECEVEVKR